MKRRECANCNFWRRNYPDPEATKASGYLQAMCDEAPDIRDRHLKRGGDSCSKWRKLEPKDPYEWTYY